MCKIHLHTRRAVSTLVKLCEIQNIMLSFECYSSFFKSLQADCPNSDNDDVYLSWNCTPSKKVVCDHQHKIWQNLKQEILSKEDHDVHINFQYFIKKETEKNGITKKCLVAESRSVNLSFIIDFIDDLLPKIVYHCNLLSNYQSAYPKVLQSLSTAEISIEFSGKLNSNFTSRDSIHVLGSDQDFRNSSLRPSKVWR